MLPCDHVTIDKVFPWLCCIRKCFTKEKEIDADDRAKMIQQIDEISDRNDKLK